MTYEIASKHKIQCDTDPNRMTTGFMPMLHIPFNFNRLLGAKWLGDLYGHLQKKEEGVEGTNWADSNNKFSFLGRDSALKKVNLSVVKIEIMVNLKFIFQPENYRFKSLTKLN